MRARKRFDTLRYANSLKMAGVESKTAEAIAEGQAAANEDIIASLFEGEDGLVCKNDLLQVESKLELKIERVEAGMKIESKDLENRLTLRLGRIMLSGVTLVSVIFSVIFGILHFISH